MYYVMSMATLNANSNVLELTHSEIDNSCSFEIYVDDSSDVIPQKLSVSGTTLSVIFDSKPSRNVECRVLIIKGTGYIDASKVAYERYLWEPWITNVKEAIDYFSEQGEITKIDLNTLSNEFNSRVPSDTVLGGVLYHSTTGNIWKKLDAQNLDYDEQSTIYSAMGDIDDLETESKNLVGAINEVKNIEVYKEIETVVGSYLGKTLYRRVLTGDITLNATNTNIGLGDLNIVKFDGYIYLYSKNRVYNGYSSATAYFNLHYSFNENTYKLYHVSQTNPAQYYIIIEYTKD